MDTKAKERRSLEMDLRQALAKGELSLVFQPLVDLALRRLRLRGSVALGSSGAWHGPAGRFIPIAEDTGLIIESANGCCARPAPRRPPGRTISRRRQRLAGAVPCDRCRCEIASALADTGLAPRRLELEITERF